MKSQFLGPAYALRSSNLSAQTCINLYPEQLEGVQGGEIGGYYNTPGQRRLATIGAGPIRGAKVSAGYLWVVSGSGVYRVSSNWTATLIGSLTSSTGRVPMESNGIEIILWPSEGWYRLNLATETLTAMVDDAIPTTQGRLTHQDGYILFTRGDGSFGWVGPLDATNPDALDFASAEGSYDYTLNVMSDHRELWIFGESSVEVWFNSGDADQPFQRSGNAYIEHGIAAPDSAAKVDNTVFWLSRDERGQGIVYRAQGYTPQRISTYAIEYAIAGYSTISDAFAYTYQQAGHHFYVLTFPTANATWAFDINTGTWAQRAYRVPVSGALIRDRSNTYAFFGGQHVVGDYEDGRIYALDPEYFTDDGAIRYWERAWTQVEQENRWIRHHRAELIAEMGVGLDGLPSVQGHDPLCLLDWSDDGGKTYSNTRELRLGLIGEFQNRAIARRLGISRNRIYRLRGSEPVKTALLGVNLDMRPARK